MVETPVNSADQDIDATVLDTFVIGVPPPVFAETNFSCGINRPESGFWHSDSSPAFQDQRHRAIIHKLYCHDRLEFSCSDRHLLSFHTRNKILV